MELSPTQYAEQQLKNGKKPKEVLKQLKDSDYEVEDAYDIVMHARAHRAWKKAAYIALLVVIIPIIAYSVVTSTPEAPAPTTTPEPQPPITQQAITAQDANICDTLDKAQRQDCINKTTIP